jgi:radical SAM superfamily enzyme YgiQ (UPF0313 family)
MMMTKKYIRWHRYRLMISARRRGPQDRDQSWETMAGPGAHSPCARIFYGRTFIELHASGDCPVKILLINPPRSPYNAILEHASEEAPRFIHRKLIGPPLGLIMVAAAVHDHDVAVLDMKGEYDLNPAAPDMAGLTRLWVERHTPRIVGVTCIASEYDYGVAILRIAKAIDPSIITVVGGLHATLCTRQCSDPAIDVVMPGQAASRFRALVAAVDAGGDPYSVKGIWYRDKNALCATVDDAPDDAVAATPLVPARHLLGRWRETYRVAGAPGPTTYIYTSLGCPYRCSFCSIWPQFSGRFYQRDVGSIISELGTVPEYPVVRFCDANTVADPAFGRRLFEAIVRSGIRKEFVIDMRFDTIAANPELVTLMARAGIKVVICGFESFRQQELERYGKSAAVEQIQTAIAILQDNGILVRGNYVVPPDYTRADFDALAQYAARFPVALAGYTILTPMPGTPFYDDVADRIIDHDLSRYNFFNCVLPTTLTLDEYYERVAALWTIRSGDRVI